VEVEEIGGVVGGVRVDHLVSGGRGWSELHGAEGCGDQDCG
jgi:hypothetical protein